MKQVHLTINVPDNKFNQLIDFLSANFGSVTTTESSGFEVPEWHQEIVLNRIKNATESDFFSLDELDSKIKL